MSWLEQLKELINVRLHKIVGNSVRCSETERMEYEQQLEGKLEQLKMRNAEIVKATAKGQVVSQKLVEGFRIVDYTLHQQFLIKQSNEKYIFEEQIEPRQLIINDNHIMNNHIMKDMLLPKTTAKTNEYVDIKLEDYNDSGENRQTYHYDRRRAVQYAERWWNSYNPKYKKFTDDCTNYISQCLHEGGIPMTGFGNRNRGWWYSGNSWSYSWTVAHAFRWYLSGAKQGIRAVEVSSAKELMLGDVICYDFEGDGRWNHNTIVVAKDANNEPLVNAHTYNSRMRYWAYRDSSAYTPNIKYKFFHILDRP
ncbi:amidase domain-containing protein [Calidifontibacillus oryziterrae]|uniref:amidase domain-containing protein n=1 Tax=Calidifontibacillus oryziterrae TaxID=1191699 RepID=UPI00031786C7|nr:amidase domain-containing protein [Calidifontibacillus oryziterrae]